MRMRFLVLLLLLLLLLGGCEAAVDCGGDQDSGCQTDMADTVRCPASKCDRVELTESVSLEFATNYTVINLICRKTNTPCEQNQACEVTDTGVAQCR